MLRKPRTGPEDPRHSMGRHRNGASWTFPNRQQQQQQQQCPVASITPSARSSGHPILLGPHRRATGAPGASIRSFRMAPSPLSPRSVVYDSLEPTRPLHEHFPTPFLLSPNRPRSGKVLAALCRTGTLLTAHCALARTMCENVVSGRASFVCDGCPFQKLTDARATRHMNDIRPGCNPPCPEGTWRPSSSRPVRAVAVHQSLARTPLARKLNPPPQPHHCEQLQQR